MAEILGLGLSHYPMLCVPDANMADILAWTMEDPDIPAHEKDPANWTPAMRGEWSNDRGAAAAAEHRRHLVRNFDRARAVLDDFQPDAVLIWGDDQYENFKEDLIPPWTVCIYPDLEVFPWRHAHESAAMEGRRNVWNEGPDQRFMLRGRPDVAKHLATGLLEAGIDVAYAYKPLHHASAGHAFVNAALYLDYHRRGFDHPVIMMPLNCYGRRVVSARGFLTRFSHDAPPDPPSPPPWRFMQMGAAVARVLRDSPHRIALVASSSWSHAFLCDRTWRLKPDTPADTRLYRAMLEHDYAAWENTSLAQIEASGQHELLNWFALLGAMRELDMQVQWAEMIRTDVFNSNKVFVQYGPV
ncbi:extradiol ring-cleavage dioxygenase [Pigmentiphaga sp. NML080357]|uniref:DODA-type extradiol aromatic ring-opening family dioxygenase n=1 Tax=unclassified Pigmentiphaga TaxID=2626614 RepID=UPI000B4101D1|nr:extradiol ring-cleavage dioxygenase [Pigmentiphaga sp. NML080357]OVZ59972.1 extradiol ring-cleavage dioxygenase [Pigmentiphaga sp. NML080357]